MRFLLTISFTLLSLFCSAQDENDCFTEKDVRYVWLDQPEEDKRTVLDALSVCPFSKDKAASMIFLAHQYLLTEEEEELRMIESLFILQTPLTDKEMKSFCKQLDRSVVTDTLDRHQTLRLYTLLVLLQAQQKTMEVADPYLIKIRSALMETPIVPSAVVNDALFSLPQKQFEAYCIAVVQHYTKHEFDKTYLDALLQYKSTEVLYNCRQRNLLMLYLSVDSLLFAEYYTERMGYVELY